MPAVATGRFTTPADLMQFYSNAGALPVSAVTRQPLPLPPTMSDLPYSPSYDLFANLEVFEGLGGGETRGQQLHCSCHSHSWGPGFEMV